MTCKRSRLKADRDSLATQLEAEELEYAAAKQRAKELYQEQYETGLAVRSLREGVALKQNTLADLDKAIADLGESLRHGTVSDHAVLRFLERKHGFDINSIKDQIVTGRKSLIKGTADGRVKTTDIGTLVIKNGIVVTIL